MRWLHVIGLAAVMWLSGGMNGMAQEGAGTMPLWPGVTPGAVAEGEGDRPTLTPFLPEAGLASGAAVVVFPGGGYGHLAADHEGDQVARWLNSLGIAAFVVRYRLGPSYSHPAMLQDAQRAVRTVRHGAARWGIDPARIGVIGFSAGGHLVSTVGTHYDMELEGVGDEVDAMSARPDFMMLIYPVITMQLDHTHRGSRMNLLGAEPTADLVWTMSSEHQVTPRTPPSFLVHTTDDAAVPVENSLGFYTALRRAGVPVEMHIFQTGRHGFGLAPEDRVLSTWAGLAERWMEQNGWLGNARE